LSCGTEKNHQTSKKLIRKSLNAKKDAIHCIGALIEPVLERRKYETEEQNNVLKTGEQKDRGAE
jgi:hypothetical protein